jgi:hypothetical protein
MLIPNKFNGYRADGTRLLHISSGGGGGQTTSTVQNTNVPEYARGYVENMLGATQKQLFNTEKVGAKEAVAPTYDADGNQLTKGSEAVEGYDKIIGFKPYQAYGGQYRTAGEVMKDPSGNPILNPDGTPKTYQGGEAVLGPDGKPIYDPGKSIAGFQDMQIAAQKGIAGMQLPGQFGTATDFATQAGQGGLKSAQDAMRFGEAGFASGQEGQRLGIAGGQLGITGGAKYGDIGAGYGRQAAGLADTALDYGQDASDIGRMGLRAEQYGRQVSGQAEDYARQAAGAGAQFAQMATDPRVTRALMNPYTQNVLDVQNEELARQAGIARTQRSSQAVRAGAFGGARQAIENAEADRNLAMMKNANTAQALQQSFQNAQAQQQFGANLNLQGLAGAQQGLGTALQGGQLGLSGIGTALQGQQGALAGVGAANQAYQTGIQGAGMGLQGVNTQLSGVDRQLAGTAQGMQGAQVGLQGVSGAQAGYGLANQAGSNLANIGSQQQAAQLGIYGAQSTAGAQQQAMEQQKINQAMQDYANTQQYPLMQLGTMSNMLRGLPMQASTTNQYQAAPNQLSQAIGTIGAGASIYNAMKPPGGAAGGLPSEFKYAKGGGIMSYDMGGEVESQLESMDEKGLAAQAKESSSPSIRRMAQRLLRERQMSKQPQGTGPMGVQYQAAQPPMPSMRAGGIIAFQKGAGGNGSKSAIEEGGDEEARIGMQERLAMPPAGGIMGAAPPAAPAPLPAPTAGGAVQQAATMPEFMKAQYADAEKRANAPLSSFMAERQAAMREAGVADISEGQQKQRAELMAEKANMGEEKERQRHLRLAEFFATWGSTPGPTLVAGMNALKKSVPSIIADEKDQKKARREIDKSIADLDNATRLEKRGEVDAAMALKLKAAEEMKALNTKFIEYQSKRESDISSAAASKYRDDMNFRSEQLRANTQRLDRLAMRETAADNKAFGQYQTAAQNEQRVLAKIADQDKLLAADREIINTALMNAKQNGGKMSPTLVPGYEASLKRITDQETAWNTQKENAARDTNLAYSRIRVRPETSTPVLGSETRDFAAPPAAAIAALKANPSKKADFDALFGPGAANEYLGK